MTLLSQQESRAWTRQPQFIVRSSKSHPGNTGEDFTDLFSNLVPSISLGGTSPGLRRFCGMVGLNLVSGSSPWYPIQKISGVASGQDFTYWIVAAYDGSTPGFFVDLRSSTDTYSRLEISVDTTTLYCRATLWNYPDSQVNILTGSALSGNTPHLFVVKRKAGVIYFGIDGVNIGSSSGLPGYLQFTSSDSRYGASLGVSTNATNGAVYASGLRLGDSWGDALEKRIAGNPWQLFAPRRTRRYISLGAGGATNYTATLTANVTSSASIIKAAKAQRQASTTAAAAIAKAAATSKAATTTASATLARSARLTRAATTTASAAISKIAAAIRSATTTTATATLGPVKAKLLTLSASVTSSATMRRVVSATRSATTTAAGLTSRVVSATRAATTTATGVLRKVISSTKAASSTLLGLLSSLTIPFGGGSFVPSLRRMFSPNRDKSFNSPDRAVTMASPDRTTALVSPPRDEI